MKIFSLLNTLRLGQQLLLILLVLPMLLAVFFTYYTGAQLVQNQNTPKTIAASLTAQSVIEKIDRNFYERSGDVQAFAYNTLARKCAVEKKAGKDVQEFINTMMSTYAVYDLMIIADDEGKIIAANTKDKEGNSLPTNHLIGKDIGSEAWYIACKKNDGPEEGIYYSDFRRNEEVKKITEKTGWGVEFAAPIKEASGNAIGVWYNFADWQATTTGIRKEAEEVLRKKDPRSRILITDRMGKIIEAEDKTLIGTTEINLPSIASDFSIQAGKNISYSTDTHIAGVFQGKGAYTFKGNQWNAVVFIPRTTFGFAILSEIKFINFLIIITTFLIISVVMAYRFSKSFSIRINALKKVISDLSRGELVKVNLDGKDELTEIGKYVNELSSGLEKTAMFAEEIGDGRLQANFVPLSEKDTLGQSLLDMKANLAKVSEEDKKRNWTAEGLAQIGEIIRSDNTSESLYERALSFVIRYTKSNQGALYLMEETDEKKYLKLETCFAFNRKKFLEKTIEIGEGLVGQVARERKFIYLTEVPENYVTISSGLGDARPRCILIVPLQLNETIHGALEIAAFETFEQYKIDFIQKIAENIASIVSTIRINNETKRLLEQSQSLTAQMKGQEEDLRQNFEELVSMQEDAERREQLLLQEIQNLKNQLKSYELK